MNKEQEGFVDSLYVAATSDNQKTFLLKGYNGIYINLKIILYF